MNTVKTIKTPSQPSQSTLLVGTYFCKKYIFPRSLKGKVLASYLHKLLKDPDLEYKLSLLKPEKWKKHYQDGGQDLVPLYFYPDECDWARLSLISNATGFSRCYIFVYLMLLNFGFLKLSKNITQWLNPDDNNISRILCKVFMDEKALLLVRTIQT
jgi:hypothetical protein